MYHIWHPIPAVLHARGVRLKTLRGYFIWHPFNGPGKGIFQEAVYIKWFFIAEENQDLSS